MNTFEQTQTSQHRSLLESVGEHPTEVPGAVGIVEMAVGPLWPVWLTLLVAPIILLAAPGLALLLIVAAVFAGPYVLVRYLLGHR